MTILGIDATGFSTSIALVKNGKQTIFNHINPSYTVNRGWNDVVNILPQLHFDFLMSNLDKLLEKNNISWNEIDSIAVSAMSGIEKNIIMAKNYAEMLGKNHSKPVVVVDHVLSHAYSSWIERDEDDFKYPILMFSSSGSHNFLALTKEKNSCEILKLKNVLDTYHGVDFHLGIGKYFFRVFNYLELNKEKNGWQTFFKLMEEGNPKKYDSLNLKMKRTYEFDDRLFNFSSLMHGISNFIQEQKKKNGKLTETEKKDLAASFQEIVTIEIVNVLLFLTRLLNVREVHLSGGISMNKCIENRVRKVINKEFPKVKVRLPKKEYRLDNAAMIASLAYYQEKYKIKFQGFEPIITK